MKLSVGQKAPVFTLLDQTGTKVNLSEQKGKWVLVYFYPKDNTSGCTKEACSLKDNMESFVKEDLTVLGISVDTIKSHEKFASKYELPFSILSDEDKVVVNKYGVWGKKKMMGREYMGINRMSFLVGPNGKIAKLYNKVKPAEHAMEVLEDLRELKSNKS